MNKDFSVRSSKDKNQPSPGEAGSFQIKALNLKLSSTPEYINEK